MRHAVWSRGAALRVAVVFRHVLAVASEPMIDLLVTAGTVITVDKSRRVITDGAIAVDGGRIAQVGPASEVTVTHPARAHIDIPHGVAMPGLVDAMATRVIRSSGPWPTTSAPGWTPASASTCSAQRWSSGEPRRGSRRPRG